MARSRARPAGHARTGAPWSGRTPASERLHMPNTARRRVCQRRRRACRLAGRRTGSSVGSGVNACGRYVVMILPRVRDPRLVTIRRGGTLTDSDHHLLALWAASCAEHVLHLFEAVQPDDPRPRQAIEHARAWVRGEVKMMEARAAGGHAMGAA